MQHKRDLAAEERGIAAQLAAGRHAVILYADKRFAGVTYHASLDEAESVLRKVSQTAGHGACFELRSPEECHGA